MPWEMKGFKRRKVGLSLHGGFAFLVVGIPSYFLKPERFGEEPAGHAFTFGIGLALTAGAVGVGILKEVGEERLFGTKKNALDLIPYGIGGLLALLLIGLESGW